MFPGNLNLTCNPQGRPKPVLLGCGIYSPDCSNGSDVTVRWYRSTQEHLARVQGELVTSGCNFKNSLPFGCHHMENFTASLNGFYWCQIEVNNICLQPSPYGRIIFNSSSEKNCSSINSAIHCPVQPQCANNSNRTCQVNVIGNTITTSTRSLEPSTSISAMSVTPVSMTGNTIIPSMESTSMSATPTLCSDGSMVPCNLGIVIGAPVGAVVVCILLVVLLVVVILCLIKRKRKKEKKVDHVSHSATSEYKVQNTE